ncbi:hypothetical protein [Thioalkalivibrio thiocyanodenitrificans]|uniref:hypothetical protein n=1 Tax=Thioalkalivibrio thiocyanodenitrificans TaxID=243063 RepID=UPI00037041D6|nr:hypothetical protein [Thioalkalivibrio thiocyanodenitrificans]
MSTVIDFNKHKRERDLKIRWRAKAEGMVQAAMELPPHHYMRRAALAAADRDFDLAEDIIRQERARRSGK